MDKKYSLYDFRIASVQPPDIDTLTSDQYWSENDFVIEKFITGDLKQKIVLKLESDHVNDRDIIHLWSRVFNQIVKHSDIDLQIHANNWYAILIIDGASIKQLKQHKDKITELVRKANLLYNTYIERLEELQKETEAITFTEEEIADVE